MCGIGLRVPSLDDQPSFPQDDFVIRTLESNLNDVTRQVQDLVRLLSGFTEQQFSAFDQAGNPFNWDVLARAAGAWPGIVTTPSTGFTPYEIFAVYNAGTSQFDITLYPGVTNQLLATNMFSTISVAVTTGVPQYVYLTLSSDGYAVTSLTWNVSTTQPTPPDATADLPPSTFYALIGILFPSSSSAAATYQIVTTNLQAFPLEWTRTTRPSAGPFDLAYEIFYYWSIGIGA